MEETKSPDSSTSESSIKSKNLKEQLEEMPALKIYLKNLQKKCKLLLQDRTLKKIEIESLKLENKKISDSLAISTLKLEKLEIINAEMSKRIQKLEQDISLNQAEIIETNQITEINKAKPEVNIEEKIYLFESELELLNSFLTISASQPSQLALEIKKINFELHEINKKIKELNEIIVASPRFELELENKNDEIVENFDCNSNRGEDFIINEVAKWNIENENKEQNIKNNEEILVLKDLIRNLQKENQLVKAKEEAYLREILNLKNEIAIEKRGTFIKDSKYQEDISGVKAELARRNQFCENLYKELCTIRGNNKRLNLKLAIEKNLELSVPKTIDNQDLVDKISKLTQELSQKSTELEGYLSLSPFYVNPDNKYKKQEELVEHLLQQNTGLKGDKMLLEDEIARLKILDRKSKIFLEKYQNLEKDKEVLEKKNHELMHELENSLRDTLENGSKSDRSTGDSATINQDQLTRYKLLLKVTEEEISSLREKNSNLDLELSQLKKGPATHEDHAFSLNEAEDSKENTKILKDLLGQLTAENHEKTQIIINLKIEKERAEANYRKEKSKIATLKQKLQAADTNSMVVVRQQAFSQIGSPISEACTMLLSLKADNVNWVLLKYHDKSYEWKVGDEVSISKSWKDELIDFDELKATLVDLSVISHSKSIPSLKDTEYRNSLNIIVTDNTSREHKHSTSEFQLPIETSLSRRDSLVSRNSLHVIDSEILSERRKSESPYPNIETLENRSNESSYSRYSLDSKKFFEENEEKLAEKKSIIKLHKEQISLLKQQLREAEEKIKIASALDFGYIKSLFNNLIRHIPELDTEPEKIVAMLMKMLGFTVTEIQKLAEERKMKKKKSGKK
ncbi:unnamed protein product [Blepharisma stoltei]|uniref:GRIP domain-containing protein n=1 Tax=Blepharisma stoltei TaxID=1481888 RepID=A0AAU9K4J5_9CILI|nr:unnamed protein product [Blepharisma stoltei]